MKNIIQLRFRFTIFTLGLLLNTICYGSNSENPNRILSNIVISHHFCTTALAQQKAEIAAYIGMRCWGETWQDCLNTYDSELLKDWENPQAAISIKASRRLSIIQLKVEAGRESRNDVKTFVEQNDIYKS